jgi:acyl dehydratase
VTLHSFATPPDKRYFEDYVAGHVYEFGTISVSEAEIIDFAKKFDPQDFHTDPEKAKSSRFGGLIASGWHTVGLAMRLYVDHFVSHVASLASPGTDEVRWPNPVRPGDTLRIRVTILEARVTSKQDRGLVRAKLEAFNQKDEPVLSLIGLSIFGRRPQA